MFPLSTKGRIQGVYTTNGPACEVLVLKFTLTLCIRETPKRVLLQTVKTQMKCSKMLHFIRVCTVCNGKKGLQTKECNNFFFF